MPPSLSRLFLFLHKADGDLGYGALMSPQFPGALVIAFGIDRLNRLGFVKF